MRDDISFWPDETLGVAYIAATNLIGNNIRLANPSGGTIDIQYRDPPATTTVRTTTTTRPTTTTEPPSSAKPSITSTTTRRPIDDGDGNTERVTVIMSASVKIQPDLYLFFLLFIAAILTNRN